jgi:CBS domain-containing protein
VFREYGVDPLERHFVEDVMTKDVVTISGTCTVRDVMRDYFGVGQRHRGYPVVRGVQVLGVLDRSTLDALPPEALERSVAELFTGKNTLNVFATPAETCRAVALRLAADGLERIAVVEDAVSRRLIGILTRSDLLKPSTLVHEEDFRREKVFGGVRKPSS